MTARVVSVRFVNTLLLVLVALLPLRAQTVTSFSFPERGGTSVTTAGTSSALGVGYARINQSGAVPAGFATFGLRQNNVLVSEATVPAADLVTEGRIYAEIGNGVDTGIALVNANDYPVDVGFYFTDANGGVYGSSVTTVAARGQIARFLSQAPFNGGSSLLGTFTFFALRADPNTKVAALALRGFTNERGDFLMTTLPIAPVGPPEIPNGNTLPHFAAGAGWTTQVILVNQTEDVLDGRITFQDQAGQPTVVASESGSSSSFNYRIAPKSAWRLRTSDSGAIRVGSVRISSDVPNADLPVAFLVFSYRSAGVTVSAAGVPSVRPTAAARLFLESSGPLGPASLRTGLAIANVSSTAPVRVSLDVTALDGSATSFRGELDIPAGGQTAKFVNELAGFTTMPANFQGVLRISSTGSIAVMGLRGRYNERGEFLASTTPTVNENDPYFNLALQYSQFVFPHFADGGGYSTQFVLFSGWNPGSVSGNLEFVTQAGLPYPVELRR